MAPQVKQSPEEDTEGVTERSFPICAAFLYHLASVACAFLLPRDGHSVVLPTHRDARRKNLVIWEALEEAPEDKRNTKQLQYQISSVKASWS